MLKYTECMKLDGTIIDVVNHYCDPDHPVYCDNDELLFDNEVVFPDGMRIAVQAWGSQSDFNEEFPPPAWTQGVLYCPQGTELGCTDVGEQLDGEYVLEFDNVQYTVVVEAE